MKVYQVGGAVRDALLGLPVHDRDWVVVGATPEQMLAKGFVAVGKDFPVFLHPQTHEEYALARTERKTAPGYHGFAFYTDPSVTLEEDLARRDLTINAIAQDSTGVLVDPYGGQKDLREKVLRHVTGAFAEDPVRILRVARFAARYIDFQVAPETLDLMRQMVAEGEVDALVAERVWQEISRGLKEKKPSRMITVLRDCGALRKILPQIDDLFDIQKKSNHLSQSRQVNWGEHIQAALDIGASHSSSLAIQFALFIAFPDDCKEEQRVNHVEQIAKGLRVPIECRELAILSAKEKDKIHVSTVMNGHAIYELFKRSAAFRQTDRFLDLLKIAEIDALAYQSKQTSVQKKYLEQTLRAVLMLDNKAIVHQAIQQGKKGKEVGEALEQARLQETIRCWGKSMDVL